MSDHQEIKFELHPSTCCDDAKRAAHVEKCARRFAAMLGQELTPAMRPPQVCYDLALVVALGLVSPDTAEQLLDAVQSLRQRSPEQCPMCWLMHQLSQQAHATSRRYLIDSVAADYGRPNV